MAELTENLLLVKPAADDYYDVDVFNDNMDKIDRNAVKSSSVSQITALTQSAYDAISEADPTTLYIITEEST